MNTEKALARLRHYHVEFDDDMSQIFDLPQVRDNHPHAVIKLVMALNSSVKRLNGCYAQRQPNNAHIASALRQSMNIMHELERHHVDKYMPQGVDLVIPRQHGDVDFPASNVKGDPQYVDISDLRRSALASDDKRPEFVQIRHPLNKNYLKVSTETGRVVAHTKKDKPIKGIPSLHDYLKSRGITPLSPEPTKDKKA